MSHWMRAVLATAAVLLATGTSQAGETANRQDLNGFRKNGLDQNGIRKNGIQLNRLAFNGTSAGLPQQLNGIPLHQVSVR